MQRKPSRSVSSNSGRLTPSMPTKYRASITDIHETSTLNCRAPRASAAPNAPGACASNPNSMATPMASGMAVNRMPRLRVSRSRSPGTRATTSAPSVGRNTARVIAQSSKLIVPPSDPGVDHGEDGHAGEQDDRVPLHVPRLDIPEQPTGPAGADGHAVHRPVDHVAIDGVGPRSEPAGGPRRAVDQPVEDPLARPVDEPGDRILDRTNDPP